MLIVLTTSLCVQSHFIIYFLLFQSIIDHHTSDSWSKNVINNLTQSNWALYRVFVDVQFFMEQQLSQAHLLC